MTVRQLNSNRGRSGFTLIELLVVIAIIAVLQFVQISFVRANDEGGSYLAGFNPEDSTFCPGDGRSIPPGKYKVSVQIMKKHKDLLKGRFSPAKTPFVFEIQTGNEEIKIDLGKVPDPTPTRKSKA